MGERLDPQKIRRVAIVVKPGLSESYFERLVTALEKRGAEIAEVRHDDKPDGASEPDLVFVSRENRDRIGAVALRAGELG